MITVIIIMLVTYLVIFSILTVAWKDESRERALFIMEHWVKADIIFNEEQWYYNPENHKEIMYESELRRMLGENDKQAQPPY